jgi:hypothetical protein
MCGLFPGQQRNSYVRLSRRRRRAYSPQNAVRPFVVGWMDTARRFIYILDDDSLDILVNTRDTITDFVEYLRWKEACYSPHGITTLIFSTRARKSCLQTIS